MMAVSVISESAEEGRERDEGKGTGKPRENTAEKKAVKPPFINLSRSPVLNNHLRHGITPAIHGIIGVIYYAGGFGNAIEYMKVSIILCINILSDV